MARKSGCLLVLEALFWIVGLWTYTCQGINLVRAEGGLEISGISRALTQDLLEFVVCLGKYEILFQQILK